MTDARMWLPEPEVFRDEAALFEAAAETISRALRASQNANRRTTFVLAGGQTPREVYRKLAAAKTGVEWDRVEFFWGDERCVPPTSPDSNFRMAQECLLSGLKVPENHVHRIRAEMPDSEAAARSYVEEIRAAFAGAALPRFDVVLLGMGTDGHTASLFPGTHWDENRLIIVNEAPNPPRRRISMTPRLINAAAHVVFVVSGPAKAKALKQILNDPACDLPAGMIRPTNGTLTWLVDHAAAS